MVIWFAGLSGAGKSTLCEAIYARLKPRMPELVLLDGDAIRAGVSADLGYTEADRTVQVSRVQRLARLLSEQGLVVMVAVVYASPALLEWNRSQIPGYFEVLLDAPLALVTGRDPKGLYARAGRGETRDVVGVDIPWHRPAASDLVLDAGAGAGATVEELASRVVNAVPVLAARWTS